LPRTVQPPANDDLAGLQIHRVLFRCALFLQEGRLARTFALGTLENSPSFLCALCVLCVKAFRRPPNALSGTPTGPSAPVSLRCRPQHKLRRLRQFRIDKVSVTSESPIGGRLAVPLKMQSDIRSARSDLWLCSPRTHEMASTMLDLPQPFGPMMQVSPLPLNVICVFSQNDLKPTSSTLRSFSKISPLWLRRRALGRSRKSPIHTIPNFGRDGFRFLGRTFELRQNR
jgi:hypothetical protein